MKLLFVVLIAVSAASAKYLCKPGSKYQPDSCNICYCSEDGLSKDCTRVNCTKDIAASNIISSRPSTFVCEPGLKFKKYCNTCACAIDGSSFICTRAQCDPEVWNEDGTLKHDSWKRLSVRSASKRVCEPRSQFKNYCNTCFCNDDGSSFSCTRMSCPPELWNEDGSLKFVDAPLEESEEPKQMCKPRSHFMEYCNHCTCAGDGTTYSCTLMLCDENVWNKDGTRKINNGE